MYLVLHQRKAVVSPTLSNKNLETIQILIPTFPQKKGESVEESYR